MHLLPEDRAHRPGIDEHKACEAAGGIGDPKTVRRWAGRFSMLADPNRLAVLLAIHRAGPIAVTDLALATGVSESSVSQILRLLRVSETVAAAKDGRVVRYQLVDRDTAALLDAVGALREPV